jgi:hypothetical protein
MLPIDAKGAQMSKRQMDPNLIVALAIVAVVAVVAIFFGRHFSAQVYDRGPKIETNGEVAPLLKKQ